MQSCQQLCSRKHLESSDSASWRLRVGDEVLCHSQEWKNARTHLIREAIFKRYGVRWSPLNLLPYPNPVRHASLGIPHNWLEGVLQYHARRHWGLGITSEDRSAIKITTAGGNVLVPLQLDEEILALEDESGALFEAPISLLRRTLHQLGSYSADSSGEETEDPDYLQPDTDSDSDVSSMSDTEVSVLQTEVECSSIFGN